MKMPNKKRLRVAVIAPPWLTIPPKGYGGIEAVVDGLTKGLVKLGVDVELFTIQGTKVPKGVKIHALYDSEQYQYIAMALFDNFPVLAAQMQFALNRIREAGDFDIIHDHMTFLGPQVLAAATMDERLPPAVHTLPGPPFSTEETIAGGLPDNRPFWSQLGQSTGRMYLIGISDMLMRTAPESLHHAILGTVYNAIDVDLFPFQAKKSDYFITLARFTKVKGHHIAAKLCEEGGYKLKMAGVVGGITSASQLQRELKDPDSRYRHQDGLDYYEEEILPFIESNSAIEYVGNKGGDEKLKFIGGAKALLFPIEWDEPFGLAVIEALACGTPVVAMNRGAMPEIIQHGYNGFLADNEQEFAEYMHRVDEINPRHCRKSVEERFSSDAMAKAYLERYKEVLARTKK